MINDLKTDATEDVPWELFHENSKVSLSGRHPSFKLHPTDATIVSMMRQLHTVHPYVDCPKVVLPDILPPSTRPFDNVLRERVTARSFRPAAIGLDQLAKVLSMSYGITQSSEGTPFPRDFRVIPSGGALFPLEIYFYAARVDGLEPGLYHYNPEANNLDQLRKGDELASVARLFIQPDLAEASAAIFFIAAYFGRSVFKYGDRGYRFILLEAGHLAQNANLTAQEMGLATANIGGYVDRDTDRYLRLDGVNQSTIYALMIGQPDRGRTSTHDDHVTFTMASD